MSGNHSRMEKEVRTAELMIDIFYTFINLAHNCQGSVKFRIGNKRVGASLRNTIPKWCLRTKIEPLNG